jgi:predicted phosphoadenosine phosphosulfate sulfurtransferase
MWTANSKKDDEYIRIILAWLPKKEQEDILERADTYIWWQENGGGWTLDDDTKCLIRHAYVLASSQALNKDEDDR